MRSQLETIDLVSRYYMQEMNQQERRAFEDQLNTDDSLKEELELHRILIGGLKRMVLVEQIAHARKIFRLKRWLKWIASGIILSGIVVALWHMHTLSGSSAGVIREQEELPSCASKSAEDKKDQISLGEGITVRPSPAKHAVKLPAADSTNILDRSTFIKDQRESHHIHNEPGYTAYFKESTSPTLRGYLNRKNELKQVSAIPIVQGDSKRGIFHRRKKDKEKEARLLPALFHLVAEEWGRDKITGKRARAHRIAVDEKPDIRNLASQENGVHWEDGRPKDFLYTNIKGRQ